MSFWSGEKLESRLDSEGLIKPFDKDNIDCAAYTLTLGGCAYTSGDGDERKEAFKKGRTPGEWKLGPDDTITIQSGQFAFLLTEESVTIPHDAVGFISVKATHKFAGLINVSGFHVDPGWSSPLIFAVFNAGPRELIFRRGQKLFLLFYADLDRVSKVVKGSSTKGFDHIPVEFKQKMAGNVPSLYKLDKETQDLDARIKNTEARSVLATGIAGVALTLSTLILGKLLFFSDSPKHEPQSPSLVSFVYTSSEPHSPIQQPQEASGSIASKAAEEKKGTIVTSPLPALADKPK